ncbi:MAG: phosphoserine aminotransferase [Actinomycetota bacterium]|nr:phosphoserine aminotransferase [Actinomycetota bacterium]
MSDATSTTTPTITLPAELLPTDGRFGSGPSKVRNDAMHHLLAASPSYMGTSHRRPAVRSMVRRVREGLAALFVLPDGYEVLLGNGGSTLFWDAAAFGLVERRAQHLVCGEFSAKFANVTRAAPHLEDPDVIESAPGTAPVAKANSDVDTYAFPHNETSTGVMLPVSRPDGARSGEHDLVLVDATSAAGGLRIDPRAFDVYYFAPQKCFAGDAGVWLALCSPTAVERIERIAASDRWVPPSLDLGIALEQSRLDQTYNTPALATLFLLADQVEWMLGNGGLEWTAGRCDESAATIYSWADAGSLTTPFVTDPALRSRVTATIDFDASVDAAALAQVLRANGILDVEPYRKLGRNQLRIGLFPAIEPADVAVLTKAIDHIVERLGG